MIFDVNEENLREEIASTCVCVYVVKVTSGRRVEKAKRKKEEEGEGESNLLD